MGWFFRKSLRLMPGVRLNLSKHGPSISLGARGLRTSLNTHGQARVSAGLGPLRYQKQIQNNPPRSVEAHERGLMTWVKRFLTR